VQNKPSISDHYQYGKRLLRHKAFMIRPGRTIGAPYGTLLAHDLSKFRPSEWKPYVAYWQGPKGITGTKDPEVTRKFREAAALHYKRNPHHAHKLGLVSERKNKLEAVTDWYATSKANQANTKDFPSFGTWVRTQSPAARKNLIDLGINTEKLAMQDKVTLIFKKYAEVQDLKAKIRSGVTNIKNNEGVAKATATVKAIDKKIN